MIWQNHGSPQSKFVEHICIHLRERSIFILGTAIKKKKNWHAILDPDYETGKLKMQEI